MIFTETKLKGAWLIEPEKIEDERGFFTRTYCEKQYQKYGLNTNWVQSNVSFNKKKGTLRGMHYQTAPHEEIKLVRCTHGAIYDVIIDLRPNSSTFKQWVAAELTAENYRMFYVPPGFAHGFITLQDETQIYYQMSEFYHGESARGVRWNDDNFGIIWPLKIEVISQRDAEYTNFG